MLSFMCSPGWRVKARLDTYAVDGNVTPRRKTAGQQYADPLIADAKVLHVELQRCVYEKTCQRFCESCEEVPRASITTCAWRTVCIIIIFVS